MFCFVMYATMVGDMEIGYVVCCMFRALALFLVISIVDMFHVKWCIRKSWSSLSCSII